jgi:predicted  nucleic acid-binding Zn-ribbon protein
MMQTKAEITEHYKQWPKLKCTNCGIQYGGFPQDVNAGCPHCAMRDPESGRIAQIRGMLQARPVEEVDEHFAEREE